MNWQQARLTIKTNTLMTGGSPACIAGHAAHLSGIEGLDWPSGSEIETAARHWMGIDNYTGSKMFDGMPLGYAVEVHKAGCHYDAY